MVFEVCASTPAGLLDPSIAIAASRAGGVGVLDLEHAMGGEAATSALATLARLGRGELGIRLGGDAPAIARAVIQRLPDEIGTVILTFAALVTLGDEFAALRARGVRILVEVQDGDQAKAAAEARVAGLIARGLESGGFIGEETTLILLQRLLGTVSLPVWAHGGIGLHTAAACRAAGAAGVVLDTQLALARESALPATAKAAIGRMDGSETVTLGAELHAPFRAFVRPGLGVVDELRELAARLAEDGRPLAVRVDEWRVAVRARVGWGERDLWPLGQDATFAAALATRHGTAGGIVRAILESAEPRMESAHRASILGPDAPLARAHGTRYPILQGPMTRVSDTAAFAEAVAAAGALPFLALALLRGPEVQALLEETRLRLGDRPWGVGILGFVPLELRQEQLEVIHAARPPFALIAGGRPDQALSLEREGIPTYLHVPSPELLRMFVEGGARRFVFEGRECGGHVGPRSSFVLWNTMVDVLLDSVAAGDGANCHVIFAGGIHDARSAAMVAALAAPLAERGMKVGVLLGTAYLFTEEAVRTGAITETFQEEAVACVRTALLETGPGHATRCVATHFADVFERERRRLVAEGRPAEEARDALEELNLGRLRMATKGITRNPRGGERGFIELDADEQRREGLFMIGQVATLRDRLTTMAALHEDVADGGALLLAARAPALRAEVGVPRPCDIAIIGMSCILPKAPDLETYWANILNKVDAITEIPADRFDWRRYFDADPAARDKIYSRWGGFIDPVPFDPMRYGMPPASLPSIEPLHLLLLEAVRSALGDAGYAGREFARARTGVIVGVGGGVGDLGQRYTVRAGLPQLDPGAPAEVWEHLPEWTEDSFAGILLNVAAGRVANRFDLGGVNYTVDAACASSLAALYAGVRELEAHTADMMIVAGGDNVQNPFGYLCFSKTRALSPRGRCRAFDEDADGIVISEGLAVVVLKRLADAERDGDRIYGVIKAVAASSDGRDRSMTAPRPEGQLLALERAYATAGISPASVRLVEAHGTGTVAGDEAEVGALTRMFAPASSDRQWCALGSVKSMIGHTKCAAGLAGLLKVAKAVYHKVLPPTMGVERPNGKARFAEGPFYVNTEARPWLEPDGGPRRGAVSSFGFGGTNFHAVIEEYQGAVPAAEAPAALEAWPAELFLVVSASSAGLVAGIDELRARADAAPTMPLRRLAADTWEKTRAARAGLNRQALTLAIVAGSHADLLDKLGQARDKLGRGAVAIEDPRGIYYTEAPLRREGSVAFLFPGQGSQYPAMMRELALSFGEIGACLETASRRLAACYPEPLHRYVLPPPWFSLEEERAREDALRQTNVAQPALGAMGLGVARLLRSLGVEPDAAAGHSYGEYVALCAAGTLAEETLYELSEARGRAIIDSAGPDLGTMAAVQAGRDEVTAALTGLDEVWIANVNGPRQTVVSGTCAGVARAQARLEAVGLRVRPVAVACAFHSPLLREAAARFAERLAPVALAAPRIPVYGNADATPYEKDACAIRRRLAAHLTQPVRFMDEVEAMYAAGSRIFVEVGPRNILTALTQQTLEGRRALAIATDVTGRPGLVQLLHAAGQLAVHGVPVNLDRLFASRLTAADAPAPPAPTTWLVTAAAARPLGQAPAQARPVAAASRLGPAEGLASPPAATVPAREPQRAAAPVQGRATTTPSGAPSPSATPGAAGDAGDLMLEFQRTMSRFLDTQRRVMLAFLGEEAEPIPAPLPDAGTVGQHQPPPTSAPALPALELAPPAPHREAPAPAAALTGSVEDVRGLAPDALERELARVVSERTGYPPEMLGLDLNLEADLGIDSIKRVEILGALQRAVSAAVAEAIRGQLETLTKAKTLRQIIERLAAPASAEPARPVARPVAVAGRPAATPGGARSVVTNGSAAHGAAAGASNGAATPRIPVDREVPRFLPTLVDAPLPPGSPARLPAGVILLTEDARGVAARVAAALSDEGVTVVLAKPAARSEMLGPGRYALPLEDPVAVAALASAVAREHGAIGGVLHLVPLDAPGAWRALDAGAWRARLSIDVKGLFALVRAAGPEIQAATGGVVLAVTALGGGFGLDGTPMGFPGHGGVVGLVKTLAAEWPGTRVKVVDLDGAAPTETLARQILGELRAADGEVEVGHVGARRVVPRVRRAPRAERAGAEPLAPGSVVLVTGGARGITAEVAIDLARRYRPTLVLVGQSPLPDGEEPADTAELAPGPALRGALVARMRAAGGSPAPAELEAAHRSLVRDREVRQRLAAMREAGATVRYHQVDVRDTEALASLLAECYRTHGRIDAVIHGAGLIEDRLVLDKTQTSFDRVFDTKADSAFALARGLDPRTLRWLAFFSSVAGRFANRGQADYAAANEVMDKLACALDREWPGRVVALNWGPWAGGGMVSGEVARQFAERGIGLVDPAAGSRALDAELRSGAKGEAEVVLGQGPWPLAPDLTVPAPAATVSVAPPKRPTNGAGPLELTHELSLGRDLYLDDHRLDGKPVLPAAMAAELMAEAAGAAWPEWQVTEVRGLRLFRGVVLQNGVKPIRVVATPRPVAGARADERQVDVEIAETNAGAPSYRGTVVFQPRLPDAPRWDGPDVDELRPFPMDAAEMYRTLLFHGPRLQCITEIKGISSRALLARVRPSTPAACLSGAVPPDWHLDPVLLDAVPQLAIVWARLTLGATALPASIRAVRRYRLAAAGAGPLSCHFRIDPRSTKHTVVADAYFLGPDRRLVLAVEGLESTASHTLNRLAAQRER